MKRETKYSITLFLWISYNCSCSLLWVTPFFHSCCQFVGARPVVRANVSLLRRRVVQSTIIASRNGACEHVRRWKRYILLSISHCVATVSASRVHACVIDRRVLLRRAACAVTCNVTGRKLWMDIIRELSRINHGIARYQDVDIITCIMWWYVSLLVFRITGEKTLSIR